MSFVPIRTSQLLLNSEAQLASIRLLLLRQPQETRLLPAGEASEAWGYDHQEDAKQVDVPTY